MNTYYNDFTVSDQLMKEMLKHLSIKDELREKFESNIFDYLNECFDDIINIVLIMRNGSLSDPKIIRKIETEIRKVKVVYFIGENNEILYGYPQKGYLRQVEKDTFKIMKFYNHTNSFPVQLKAYIVEECDYRAPLTGLLFRLVKRKEEAYE